jgi:serine/threonine protein kinase
MLADMKRAPVLRFCERVESVGMYVVVMSYEGRIHANGPLKDEQHIEQLREAARTLHDGNYVHGDLRGPNVLITEEGPKIIDFDWSGEVGTARYPPDILVDADHGWHHGVSRGGLIAKEHDEHLLELLTGPS